MDSVKKTMTAEECTILVLSCDKYQDLWNPFFKLFSIYWKDCRFPVILVAEKQEYICPFLDVDVFTISGRGDIPWSKRVLQCLKSVNTKYVLILMDDFFLREKVHIDEINKCFQWMEEDDNIALFSFVPSLWEDEPAPEYQGYQKRPVGGLYRVNCQAGLWNRKKLMMLMRPVESPWEFEWEASNRSNFTRWEFYASAKGEPWKFNYDFSSGGGGVHRGRWTKGVKEVFDKNGIEIDYSIRGWDDHPAPPLSLEPEPNPPMTVEPLSVRGWWMYFRGRIKFFVTHIDDYLRAYVR